MHEGRTYIHTCIELMNSVIPPILLLRCCLRNILKFHSGSSAVFRSTLNPGRYQCLLLLLITIDPWPGQKTPRQLQADRSACRPFGGPLPPPTATTTRRFCTRRHVGSRRRSEGSSKLWQGRMPCLDSNSTCACTCRCSRPFSCVLT